MIQLFLPFLLFIFIYIFFYFIGLPFVKLLVKDRKKYEYLLAVLTGLALINVSVQLSYLGISIDFIMIGLIVVVFIGYYFVIRRKDLPSINGRTLLIWLPVILISFSVSLLPLFKAKTLTTFTVGNNDPYFHVSRAEYLKHHSLKEIDDRFVNSFYPDRYTLLIAKKREGDFAGVHGLALFSRLVLSEALKLFSVYTSVLNSLILVSIFILFVFFLKLSEKAGYVAIFFIVANPLYYYLAYDGWLNHVVGVIFFFMALGSSINYIKKGTHSLMIYAAIFIASLASSYFPLLLYWVLFFGFFIFIESFRAFKKTLARFSMLILLSLLLSPFACINLGKKLIQFVSPEGVMTGRIFQFYPSPPFFSIFGVRPFMGEGIVYSPPFSREVVMCILFIIIALTIFGIFYKEKHDYLVFSRIAIFLSVLLGAGLFLRFPHNRYLYFKHISFTFPFLFFAVAIGVESFIKACRRTKAAKISVFFSSAVILLLLFFNVTSSCALARRSTKKFKWVDYQFMKMRKHCSTIPDQKIIGIYFGGYWDQLFLVHLLRDKKLTLLDPSPCLTYPVKPRRDFDYLIDKRFLILGGKPVRRHFIIKSLRSLDKKIYLKIGWDSWKRELDSREIAWMRKDGIISLFSKSQRTGKVKMLLIPPQKAQSRIRVFLNNTLIDTFTLEKDKEYLSPHLSLERGENLIEFSQLNNNRVGISDIKFIELSD